MSDYIEIPAIVRAYSPQDKIDANYRHHHPIPKTATGVLVSDAPSGIAANFSGLPAGTRVLVPGYCNGELVTVDDTGANLRAVKSFPIHIEVRFLTEEEALAWGVKHLTIKVER